MSGQRLKITFSLLELQIEGLGGRKTNEATEYKKDWVKEEN